MSARKLPWLIAYDIRAPDRLARLHRWLTRRAAPVQYSVFVGRYDAKEIDWISGAILRIIDARVDDVRLYPIPEAPSMLLIGRQRCPRGWSLLDALADPRAQAPLPPPGDPRGAGTSTQVSERKGRSTPERFEPTP
jgi:CRISPR-associated protein Cas2